MRFAFAVGKGGSKAAKGAPAGIKRKAHTLLDGEGEGPEPSEAGPSEASVLPGTTETSARCMHSFPFVPCSTLPYTFGSSTGALLDFSTSQHSKSGVGSQLWLMGLYMLLSSLKHSLAKHTWLYCVLEKGHIIRNPKNRITYVSSYASVHNCLATKPTWSEFCSKPFCTWLLLLLLDQPCMYGSSQHRSAYVTLLAIVQSALC